METKLTEIAERIKALRDICGFDVAEMAEVTRQLIEGLSSALPL